MSTTQSTETQPRRDNSEPLSPIRLNLMRLGFLFMAVGLIVYRWPLLPEASELPVMHGVVVTMLTGMSLLALLGLRHPLQMLPVLVFEVAWKLIWLGVVAAPHFIANDMDAATETLLNNVLFVVIPLAVTPWDYVWKRYVKTPGDRWRR
jgi:hypothetical protein